MNEKIEIKGGRSLSGEICVQGSKNESFMIINASLIVPGIFNIYNVPNILDIQNLFKMLRCLDVEIDFVKDKVVKIDSRFLNIEKINDENFKSHFKKIRGGISIVGALLSRFKKAKLYSPGGDKIGLRRLDTHIQGFLDFGAKVEYDFLEDSYSIFGETLVAKDILLEEASQTGTANIILSSVFIDGKSTIYNAACETNISQLCLFLNKMGAKISGIGTNFLTIEGVKSLNSADHKILPDNLDIGSFICVSIATNSSLMIKSAGVKDLYPVLNVFKKLGNFIEISGDDIVLNPQKDDKKFEQENYSKIISISDAPWPGFPADLISPLIVASIFCDKKVLVHQKMYESRLFFTDNLINMGANLILCDPHRVFISGSKSTKLRGINMSSPDIRAGISLIIAALAAEGKSVISNIEQVKRGYEDIFQRLISIGADIIYLQ